MNQKKYRIKSLIKSLDRNDLHWIMRETINLYDRPTISYPTDSLKYLDIKYKDQEHFVVLTLNGAHKVINSHTVSIGTLNRTLIHPREVFKPAIKDNSASIIIAHNHPSGSLEPSKEDLSVTKRLVNAGELMGIKVLDHLIVSELGYYSFIENNQI